MNEQIRKLDEQIQALLDEGEQLVTRSDTTLTPEDDTRFDEIEAEVAQLRERRAKVVRALAASSAGHVDKGANTIVRRDPFADRRAFTGHESRAELRDGAKRALEHLDKRSLYLERADRLTDLSTEAARQIITFSDPAYESAFLKVFTYGPADGFVRFDEQERAAWQRAMSLTSAEGGYGVPIAIDQTWILQADQSSNYLRQVARVEGGMTDKWRGINTAGVTAAFAAEATEVADGSPSDLTQPTVTAHRAHAFVKASYELQDDYPGLAEEVGRAFAFAKDSLEATKFTTGAGNGSNEPVGFVTALDANTNAELANTTSNTFGLADVYGAYEAVGDRYRGNASWHMNVTFVGDTRQFGTDQYNTQTVTLTERTLPALLGRPVFENGAMDSAITTGETNNIIVFGDFKEFLIYDRMGATVHPVPVIIGGNQRPTGEFGWYFRWRTGSDIVNDPTSSSKPFVLLQTETNA